MATVSNAAVNLCAQALCGRTFSVLLGVRRRVGLPGCVVTPFNVLGSRGTVPKVANTVLHSLLTSVITPGSFFFPNQIHISQLSEFS